MKTILVEVPDSIEVLDLSGEVSGHQILVWVDKATNRLLVDVNMTVCHVVVDGGEPTTPPPPEPVTYTTYHLLQNMNIRAKPTTQSAIVGSGSTNQNMELSTEKVTPSVLTRLGLPADTPIEAGYEWRAIQGSPVKFIASMIGTKATVATGAYVPPVSTTGKPTTLSGKNLRLVDTGDWVYLEGGKGMGANLREMAYWGTGVAPYMSTNDYDRYFAFLRDNGFKWVRFYCFHKSMETSGAYDVDAVIARVRVVCDKLKAYGLLGCLVLMDSLGDSGFTFPYYVNKRGEQLPYHRESMGHLHKSFYLEQAWKSPLQPAMEKLVTALKGHLGVGMWQIMNEPAIYPQPSASADALAMENMFRVLSERIHAIDPGTPKSGGFISTHHFAPTGADRRAYSANFWKTQPNLHVATIHAYQDMNNPSGLFAGESEMHIDLEEAHKSGRAVGITEFGSNSSRVNVETGFLERTLIQRRGSFAMRWALENETVGKGIGDNKWGWMRVAPFTDFDALLALFKSYMGRI